MKATLRKIIQPLRLSFWEERHEVQRRERAMIEFYRQFIKPGDVCFDVGANVGNRTSVFLKLGATVVAVEPQEVCIKALNKRFDGNPKFTLVPEALGAQLGHAELLISDATTISSMSTDWIEKVRASGRFTGYTWQTAKTVSLTTLDALISRYGMPGFVKIDVEGFENEVLRGLSQAVPALSFEFVPEAMEGCLNCLRRLSSLGDIQCNYALGETMQLESDTWLSESSLVQRLTTLPDKTVFGDVHVRFPVVGSQDMSD